MWGWGKKESAERGGIRVKSRKGSNQVNRYRRKNRKRTDQILKIIPRLRGGLVSTWEGKRERLSPRTPLQKEEVKVRKHTKGKERKIFQIKLV